MKTSILIVFSFLIAVIDATPFQKATPRVANEEYRLPTYVKPVRYDLHLTLAEDVFTTNTFSGVLSLEFEVSNSTDNIKIHANQITFNKILLKQDLKEYNITDTYSEETEFLTLTSYEILEAGSYILEFEYEAVLREDEMYGLYKSSYINENDETQYLATTQFQATYARRALPCFDEPSFKAKFDIKITYPKVYNARSNTKVQLEEEAGDFRTTTFETTPIMPTYLVAFIISDFTCTNSVLLDSVLPYAVCSRDEAKSTRALAVEKGPLLLQAMENLTGIPYTEATIAKMDQYAIPDFAAGAMENWGLVTYRETGLLWDPLESTNSYKQSIENVISHEFAHMWFGNLITTHWWSDTFLNEGFARYYQYFGTAEVETTWELENQFVVAQLQPVLVTDTSISSAALSSPVYTPAQVSNRFTSISYSKGACVIRMVIHLMGDENYKRGINKYLENNKFGNTIPTDLWDALQNDAEEALPPTLSLSQVMDTWITKPGFPLLQVNLNGTNIDITQKRFLPSGESFENINWYVPITYTTSETINFEDTSTKKWLLPNENLAIENVIANEASWIILNNKQVGFYRVNYDDELWERIRNALNTPGFSGIHEINRAQIVDDFYNLARNGVQSYSQLLNLLLFLKKETSYAPWYSAFTAFNSMLARTGDDKIRTSLNLYILELLEVVYNTHPFQVAKDDNQIYSLHRALVASWACKLGIEDCTNNAVAAFQAYKNGTKADKNLRSVIYCNGLRHSTNPKDDWDFLWGKYTTGKLATENAIILSALGCAKDESVLTEYLKKSITANSGIRQQDALSVFSAVYSSNLEGVDIAFNFFLDNYNEITEYYTSMSSLNNLLSGIANRFTKQEQLDKLNTFLANDDLPESLLLAGKDAVTIATTNLDLIQEFENELTGFFIRSSAVSLKFSWIYVVVFFVFYNLY